MSFPRSFRARFLTFLAIASHLIACAVLSSPALAFCPRIKIYVNNEFFKSRFVIVGEVLLEREQLDRDGFLDLTDYRVRVLRTYRGLPRQVLTIRSENDSGRFPMKKGQKYLLFVRTQGGHFFIDNCGNSGPLAEAHDTIEVIQRIYKSGPYGEIDAHVWNGQDDIAGIRLVARSAKGVFSRFTGGDGWIHLKVSPGVYRVSTSSARFRLELFDLNEDRPNHLVVHKGGCVQLDYDAKPK